MLKGLSKGWFAKAFLTFYALSLGAETAHFLSVDHHFSVDKAEFIHLHGDGDCEESDEDEDCDDSGATFLTPHHCHTHADAESACPAVVSMRGRAGSQISQLAAMILPVRPRVVDVSTTPHLPRFVYTAIYRLAPKNSPPAV